MLQMFKQFFSMVTTFISAADKFFKAVENVATVTEEMSSGYLEVQRIEQAQKVAELKRKLLVDTKLLAKEVKVAA